MTVGEREREKLRDILQGMARDIDGVDMEVAEFLWGVSVMVEGGGSMAGLTRRSYWHVRARGTCDWWVRFHYAWRGFAEMSVFPPTFCATLPMCAAAMPTVAGPT